MGFMEDHVLLRGIRIDKDLDPSIPEILGEEDKLEQVFVNLIVNAAQSMDGSGVLTLRTRFVAETGQVRIECADTGHGIDTEHLGKVFEPFFTTKETGKGTGLGLSICHGIVEQHGGAMTAESREGKGSVFTILLPVRVRTEERVFRDPQTADDREPEKD
jgi:signal transduction histidine kinase